MQHRHRRAHGRIWLVLAIVLPLGLVAGLVLRQEKPIEPTVFQAVTPQ